MKALSDNITAANNKFSEQLKRIEDKVDDWYEPEDDEKKSTGSPIPEVDEVTPSNFSGNSENGDQETYWTETRSRVIPQNWKTS